METLRIENIIEDIIAYYTGIELPEYYSEEQRNIIAISNREWDELPCDSEGANSEQEAEQDEFLEKIAKEVKAEVN